jgi:hypothetical protein
MSEKCKFTLFIDSLITSTFYAFQRVCGSVYEDRIAIREIYFSDGTVTV